MGFPLRVLTAVFWTVLVATVAWVALSVRDYGAAAGMFGEGGSRLATTLLLAGLALSSGVLVLYHRRSGGDEEYWTGGELVYALALFVSLFYGIYSFFGWWFYA